MRSSIEILESRIAPAGAVAVSYTPATGALIITSTDNLAHSIHIFPTGVNTFRVEPQHIDGDVGPDTLIGTDSYQDFLGKLSSVSYTGGDLDDEVKINNFKSITTLSFDGKDGKDTLTALDITTTGDVTLKFGAQTQGGEAAGAYFIGQAITIGGNVSADFRAPVGASFPERAGGFLEIDAFTNTIKGGLTLTGGPGVDKLFLDGNVTSVGKGIDFTGDAGDDLISFDGGASLTVGPAANGRALFFDGGADQDNFEMYNDGLVNLQGKVQFDGGAGDNTTKIRADALTVKNDFIISAAAGTDVADLGPLALKVGGDLKIELGNGLNTFEHFTLSTTIAKTLSYQGGTGIDNFTLHGTSVTLSGGLAVALGDGANTVDVSPRSLKLTAPAAVAPAVVAAPALGITAGADGDTIEISADSLTVTGATLIDGGDGANTLKMNPENGTFTKDVQMTGGSGDDTMEFGRDSATLKANLTFAFGAGKNSLDLHPDYLTVTKDLKVTGLGGNDTFKPNIITLKVMGVTALDLGDGSNVVDGFITSASFGKTLTYLGGAGNDSFSLGGTGLAVKGAVDLELFGAPSGTENDVKINAAYIALGDTVKIAAGDCVNDITLGDRVLSIAKATTITLGNGGNSVFLQATQASYGALTITCADNPLDAVALGRADHIELDGAKLTAAGPVKVDLGSGQDFVNLQAAALTLKAGLTILGGADADYANIFADGTITGDVNIDLGGASDGDQTIYLSGNSGLPGILKITGALTLNSSATVGAVVYSDFIYVYDVTVTKAISATGGAVASAIYFNNASTGSTFTVNSGAGDDDVQIETFGTSGPMTIAQTTTINLGAGKDNLAIGFSSAPGSNDFVRFFGAVTVDGGVQDGQTDTVSDLSVNFFAPGVPLPVLINIP